MQLWGNTADLAKARERINRYWERRAREIRRRALALFGEGAYVVGYDSGAPDGDHAAFVTGRVGKGGVIIVDTVDYRGVHKNPEEVHDDEDKEA